MVEVMIWRGFFQQILDAIAALRPSPRRDAAPRSHRLGRLSAENRVHLSLHSAESLVGQES